MSRRPWTARRVAAFTLTLLLAPLVFAGCAAVWLINAVDDPRQTSTLTP